MNLLAGVFEGAAWEEDGKWIVGRYEDAPDHGTQIMALIGRIKANDLDSHQDDAERLLSSFGEEALPFVIEEFRSSDSDVFFCLTNVLAKIPSPERDDAFIEILSNYQSREDRWLAHWYASVMLDALGESGCQKALPVIRKIATDDSLKTEEERSHASVALNRLNAPLPARPVESFMSMADGIESLLREDPYAKAAPILFATVDQVFSPTTSTMLLQKADRIGPDKFVDDSDLSSFGFSPETMRLMNNLDSAISHIDLCGGFANHHGFWHVIVSLFENDVALVTATQHFGDLAGAGYLGRAELIDGRWLIVEWQETWVS
jgi:hypothetical protein